MRVGHVVSRLDRRSGGVAAAVIGLAAAQARAGMSVTVLSSYNAGDDNASAIDTLQAAGVTTRLVGPVAARAMGWHRGHRAAADALLDRADVLHVHALWEDVQHKAMRRARRRGRPYVVSPHGMLATWSLRQRSLKKNLFLRLLLRQNLDHAAAIHFTTAEESRQAAPMRLIPPTILEGLGLDLTEFAALPARGSFRGRYPLLAGRPFALFMSRIHPKKGLDLLVPAFARAGDAAALVIAGPDEGGYEADVRRLVDQHGLGARTIFTGMLRGPERVAALADADLFVLPSYQENFGIVVPEALAAGTPVVLSDQVNFSENLAGESFAQIVPCDVDALAPALADWLQDPQRRAHAAEAARPWAMERFDWTPIARRWIGHYADLLQKPRNRPV